MTDSVLPPSNDLVFRRLVLECYNTTLLYSGDLTIYLRTPRKDRRGRINSRAYPFRREFLHLFNLTKSIKTIVRFGDDTKRIEKWFSVTPNFKSEERMAKYYNEGLTLLDIWNKILIEQGIVEFK